MREPIIIAITGLPSSGKGTFSEIAEEYGFIKLVMGDVIRKECKKRGLPVNRESSDKVMIDLRKERGENAVAVTTLEWVSEALNNNSQKILIDGIRSLAEIQLFRQSFPQIQVIAMHANSRIRLERALSRKRIDDAYSKAEFDKRDTIELNLGIGDVISKADYLIDTSYELEQTKKDIIAVINDILNSKN